MYPLSNKASRFAVNRKPLKTFNRSASLVQSFQGFAWLARKAAFKVHPVTEQAPSQYYGL